MQQLVNPAELEEVHKLMWQDIHCERNRATAGTFTALKTTGYFLPGHFLDHSTRG
jgi:hypothetical protein